MQPTDRGCIGILWNHFWHQMSFWHYHTRAQAVAPLGSARCNLSRLVPFHIRSHNSGAQQQQTNCFLLFNLDLLYSMQTHNFKNLMHLRRQIRTHYINKPSTVRNQFALQWQYMETCISINWDNVQIWIPFYFAKRQAQNISIISQHRPWLTEIRQTTIDLWHV